MMFRARGSRALASVAFLWAIAAVLLVRPSAAGTATQTPIPRERTPRSSPEVIPAPFPATFTDVSPNNVGPLPGCGDPCAAGRTGGRVHNLASSSGRPDDVYAASEVGGLFKSVDGGGTWFHLDGHLPTKPWDVAVDPGGATVYATSTYDGRVHSRAGIEISRDGGLTWTQPASATPPEVLNCLPVRLRQPSAFGIAIRPGRPQEVLAGTNCGLARSIDSGHTWKFLDPFPNDPLFRSIWDVVALPGGLTYACGEEGVFRSQNGKTWQRVGSPSAGYCSIAAVPQYPDFVVVVFASTTFFEIAFDPRNITYFGSFDGGGHWTAMPHPDGVRTGRVSMVTMNPRSSGVDVWVGGRNLFRIPCPAPSSLAGCPLTDMSQWRGTFTDGEGDPRKAHGDSGDVLFDPRVAVDACPMLYSSDGGVYRNTLDTSPGCQDPVFEGANTGLHAFFLNDLEGVDRPGSAAEDLYMATFDNGMYATLSAGANTPSWSHPAGGDATTAAADTTQVVVIYPAVLLRADPGFVHIVEVPNTPPPSLQFIGVFTGLVDQFGPASYVLGAQVGNSVDVLTTTNLTAETVQNGTVHWTSLGWPSSAGVPCSVQVSQEGTELRFYVMSGNCGWASTNQLWTRTFGTGSWQRLDINDECTGGFGVSAADPAHPNRLYASCTGTNPPRMVRSNDGGASWAVDVELTKLMTGHGVFRSRYKTRGDGLAIGQQPQPVAGVQPVMVAFDPYDPNVLVAGGYDSGVFLSRDGGETWGLLTDPYTPGTSGIPDLPRPFFAYFDHDSGGPLQAIYIGSVGRGVWRVTLAA